MQRCSRTIVGAVLCLFLAASLQGCSEATQAHIKKGAQEVWNTAIQGACSTAIDAILNPIRETYVGNAKTTAACAAATLDAASKQTCITQFIAQIDTLTTTKKTEFKGECSQKVGNCTGKDWGLTKLKTCVDNWKATDAKGTIFTGAQAAFANQLSKYTFAAKAVRLFEVHEDGGVMSTATPILLAGVAAASAMLAVALYVRSHRGSRGIPMYDLETSPEDNFVTSPEDGLE